MNVIFHDFIEKLMQVYIDDIVIKSSSENDHLDHLRCSFERMRKYGLKMNPLKCAFGVHAGDFLGFVVHNKGIKINQNKTRNFGFQASVDKETTPVFVGEDKLVEKIHIESKWQDEGFFFSPQDQEGK